MSPSVNGGDIANTPSARPPVTPTAPASALNPPNASARRGMLRLSVGNGCTREISPHGVVSWRTGFPRNSGSTSWCSYQGSAVMTCEGMAACRELLDDPGHHLARGRHVRREVRAENDEPHEAASFTSSGPPRPDGTR